MLSAASVLAGSGLGGAHAGSVDERREDRIYGATASHESLTGSCSTESARFYEAFN